MSGSLWSSFRQGNRTEYLAQYFLTALGASAPVLRQEDIGIDFFCSVARKEGGRLIFDAPYSVQVGSAGTKEFTYGGIDKKGKWREAELRWLFSQEVPLFFCTVDKESATFKLYSSSPMWPCRYTYGNLGEVHFIPDATHDLTKEVRDSDNLLSEGAGDRHIYRIPLSTPIVDLTIRDLETDLVADAQHTLRTAIVVEQGNLRYRSLGVHFSAWLLDVISNKSTHPFKVGHFYAWNAEQGRNTSEQLEKMMPICIALALNYKAQKRDQDLAILKPVFSLFQADKIPGFVRSQIPELFA